MNPDFLEELNEAYRSARAKHSTRFKRFHVVNTSEDQQTTPQSTAFDVAKKIIEQMQKGVE